MRTSSRLAGADALAVVDAAGELATCVSDADLDASLGSLAVLLGADGVLMGEMHSSSPGAAPVVDARVSDETVYDLRLVPELAPHWRKHPIIMRHLRRPTPRVVRIGDVADGRAWLRHEVYNDLYRQVCPPQEMGVQLTWSPQRASCLALHRSGAAFAGRDRDVLDAIAPHLRAARARITERAGLARRVALLQEGLESGGDGTLLVDRGGRIVAAGSRGRDCLRRWFGVPASATRLPDELADWRRRQADPALASPLIRARGADALRVRLVSAGEEDLLVLSERRARPVEPAAVRDVLPVTRREADVLALLVAGHTNAAIGDQLGISPHTAGRHLERIFMKLGVHNRAQAVAAVLAALR
jgi:DNA-binding CsgD family transcriptional regulator